MEAVTLIAQVAPESNRLRYKVFCFLVFFHRHLNIAFQPMAPRQGQVSIPKTMNLVMDSEQW